MKITVEQRDIELGTKRNAWLCPLARAVNSILPSGFRANVGHTSLNIYSGPYCVWSQVMTDDMQYWVKALDEDCASPPTEFELDVSHPWQA
jgi:hypothetical protein